MTSVRTGETETALQPFPRPHHPTPWGGGLDTQESEEHNLGTEIHYSILNKGIITCRAYYVHLNFNDDPNSPVGYEICLRVQIYLGYDPVPFPLAKVQTDDRTQALMNSCHPTDLVM